MQAPIMGSVEADDERPIAVADDWQLQRLALLVLSDSKIDDCYSDRVKSKQIHVYRLGLY